MSAWRPIVLVVALLAGCVQVPEEGPADAGSSIRLAWSLQDCRAIIALLPVPAAAVQPRLPAGFRPASFAESGLPPDPRGEAVVGVEGWSCREGSGLNGSVPGMVYAGVFAIVHPPDALRVNGSKFHFVKWSAGVPDAGRRALLASTGASLSDVTMSIARFDATPGGNGFQATLALNGSYQFQGAAAAPSEAADAAMKRFSFTEYQPASNGSFLVWNASVENPQGFDGGGVLSLPPGILREIVGADSAQAYYLAAASASASGAIRWDRPAAS